MKFSYDLVLAYVSVLPSKAEAKDSDDDLLRRNDTFSTIVEHECYSNARVSRCSSICVCVAPVKRSELMFALY